MGPEADLVGSRLARGSRAFAAFDGEMLTAYGWLSTGPEWIGEARAEIRPAEAEAYIWNCLTVPEHRLRGLFRLLLVRILEQARAQGLRRLWIASAGGAERAVSDARFVPVLRLTPDGPGRLRAEPAPGAPRDTARAALAAIGARPDGTVAQGSQRKH